MSVDLLTVAVVKNHQSVYQVLISIPKEELHYTNVVIVLIHFTTISQATRLLVWRSLQNISRAK